MTPGTIAFVASLLLATLAGSAHGAAPAPSVVELFGLEEAGTPVRERAGWVKPKRILVNGFPGLTQALRAAVPGVEVVSMDADTGQKLASADVYIGTCSPQVLTAGKSIRWVQILTAGVEQCSNIPAISERNILLTNMQRVTGPVIAEHVMALMLALTRGLDIMIPAQATGQWRRFSMPQERMTVVQGKTMLVVGLGGIGTEVARRAHAMGMRVTATRASGRTGPDFVSYVGLPDELMKLASEADVVVNAAPLTPQTTGIFDAAFFAKMKPTAYFINIARGKSVVTDALVTALSSGQIAGAGLDVTEPEPLPARHPLWSAPNVIITPHVSSESDLGMDGRIAVAVENVKRYVAGDRMLSVVDISRGY